MKIKGLIDAKQETEEKDHFPLVKVVKVIRTETGLGLRHAMQIVNQYRKKEGDKTIEVYWNSLDTTITRIVDVQKKLELAYFSAGVVG